MKLGEFNWVIIIVIVRIMNLVGLIGVKLINKMIYYDLLKGLLILFKS